ncbi:MAG TPA: PAS domain-containing protein [Solirubrobacteraceae bacterium]|nr:PAS domain-containing protein [Solirubrobacteraceae bacterium]
MERASATGSWELNLGDETMRFSPAVHLIYGTDPDTFSPTLALVLERVHPHDLDRLRTQAAAMRTQPGPFVLVHRAIRPTGEERLIHARGWVDLDEAGIPTHAWGTATDMTESAADAREHERLTLRCALILRATEDGICGVDPDGRVTFSNAAFHKLLDRTESEVLGARLHDLVHRDPDGLESHTAAECQFANRGESHVSAFDLGFHRSDGSILSVEYVLVTVEDEPLADAVISLRDIAERRE